MVGGRHLLAIRVSEHHIFQLSQSWLRFMFEWIMLYLMYLSGKTKICFTDFVIKKGNEPQISTSLFLILFVWGLKKWVSKLASTSSSNIESEAWLWQIDKKSVRDVAKTALLSNLAMKIVSESNSHLPLLSLRLQYTSNQMLKEQPRHKMNEWKMRCHYEKVVENSSEIWQN